MTLREQAIEKWQKILSGEAADHGMKDCAFCQAHLACKGCPVAEITGFTACENTPYEDWTNHQNAYHWEKSEQRVWCSTCEHWAREELLFLEKLPDIGAELGPDPLQASIEKWENILQGDADNGSDDCPLCQHHADCEECPVYARTGQHECLGTPYKEWAEHQWFAHGQYSTRRIRCEACAVLARKELEFLKSLLPQRNFTLIDKDNSVQLLCNNRVILEFNYLTNTFERWAGIPSSLLPTDEIGRIKLGGKK